MMTIINMTPHAVTVGENTFPPSGQLARCEETWTEKILKEGIPFLSQFAYGKSNLPAEQNDIIYIVSLPVALAEPNRKDLAISVGQIRDGEGKIVGAKGLAFINQ